MKGNGYAKVTVSGRFGVKFDINFDRFDLVNRICSGIDLE